MFIYIYIFIYGHAPYFQPLRSPERACGGWARKHIQALVGWVRVVWAGMIKYRITPTPTHGPNKSTKKRGFLGEDTVV